jgi:hypothetical protein
LVVEEVEVQLVMPDLQVLLEEVVGVGEVWVLPEQQVVINNVSLQLVEFQLVESVVKLHSHFAVVAEMEVLLVPGMGGMVRLGEVVRMVQAL